MRQERLYGTTHRSAGLVSGQDTVAACQGKIEGSPFSAWVHFAFNAEERARRAIETADNGARRELDRERRGVRGHLLRRPQPRAMPRNREQSIVESSGQGSRRVGGFWLCNPFEPRANKTAIPTLDSRERRTFPAADLKLVRPWRPCILSGSSRQYERGSGEGASGSLSASGRLQPSRPGLPSQPSSETNGRDITSSIFSPLFFRRARMPASRGEQPPQASAVGKSIASLHVLMLCRPGRQKKTEGLQYLDPMENDLLCSPRELLSTDPTDNAAAYRLV